MVHNDSAWTEIDILKKPVTPEVYPVGVSLLEPRIARPVGDPGVVHETQ
jgi:hypothetical protein